MLSLTLGSYNFFNSERIFKFLFSRWKLRLCELRLGIFLKIKLGDSFQRMTSWIPGQQAPSLPEDEEEGTEVEEQIAAVDLELQQLKFEMQAELQKQEEERQHQESR